MATPASLSPWVDAGRLLGQRVRDGVHHRPRLAQSLFVVAGTALLLTIILALPFSGAHPVSGDPARGESTASPAPVATPTVTEPRLPSPLPEAPALAMATRSAMTDNTPTRDAQPTASATPAATVAPVAIDTGSAAARSALAPADHPAPFAYNLQPGARVVYLIDVSGSLVDIMPHVVDWMGDALEVMPKESRFTVLLFREGEVHEVPPAGLKPASFRMRAAAWSWMQPEEGHVQPFGRSDAADAIRKALQYDATELVILSDDTFSQHSAWGEDVQLVSNLAAAVGNRRVTIHTVQFFYRGESGALEAIADCFGGTYQFIAPPTGPGGDPLEALLSARSR